MAPPFVYDDLESRISRRARIIAVTVFVADFAVLAVNHKLAFLVFGDIFCVCNSRFLSVEILCCFCCFFVTAQQSPLCSSTVKHEIM